MSMILGESCKQCSGTAWSDKAKLSLLVDHQVPEIELRASICKASPLIYLPGLKSVNIKLDEKVKVQGTKLKLKMCLLTIKK